MENVAGPMSKRSLPMSCRSFMVSGLTFRSLIHGGFIVVDDVRVLPSSAGGWPVSLMPFTVEPVFPPLYVLTSFVLG